MKILGVKIDDISLPQAVRRVEDYLEGKKQRIFTIVTPNPEIIVQAQDDPRLRRILNAADLAVPDGVGLRLAGTQHTVAGVELMGKLCRLAAERGWVVGLYGGRGGAAAEALRKLQGEFKHLGVRRPLQGWARQPGTLNFSHSDNHVMGSVRKSEQDSFESKQNSRQEQISHSDNHVDREVRKNCQDRFGKMQSNKQGTISHFDNHVPRNIFQRKSVRGVDARVRQEIVRLRGQIEKEETRLLFVALGAPKQEFVIDELLKAEGNLEPPCPSLPVPRQAGGRRGTSSVILMAVGGAFDELSGKDRPPPQWVSRYGLKWLWRLFWQPRRIKRQLRLVRFVYLVLKDKLSNRV